MTVLGIAIGANTTVFSAYNGFFLRPMPFPDDRLMMIYDSMPKTGVDDAGTSVASYLSWRRSAKTLESAAVFTKSERTLRSDQPAEQISVTSASPSLLSVLGVAPTLGGGFTDDNAVPGNDRVVLLSHRLWTRRFGARLNVVGEDLRLDGDLFRIIGVLPEGFGFPDRDTDALIPFAYTFAAAGNDQAVGSYLQGIGRLRPEATPQSLNVELAAIARNNLVGQRSATFGEATGYTIRAEPLRDYMIGDLKQRLLLLQGLVFAVLLIACANVANLQLASLTARRKELAVRAALGAGVGQLARLLALEIVLLALGGAGGGLLFAYGGIKVVRVLGFERATDGFDLKLDAVVIIVTVISTLIAALVSALAPLIELLRQDFARSVQETGAANTGGVATQRRQNALVVAQIAVGVALLTGAGLLTKTFYVLQRQGPGFDATHVWSARAQLPKIGYSVAAVRTRFFEQSLVELRSLPGVASAGFATTLPFTGTDDAATVVVDGSEPVDGAVPPVAQLHSIDDGYFPTLGIPIVAGRNFVANELERVAIVDESFARAHWADRSAVGQRLRSTSDSSTNWYTIVGVVPDVKHDSFTHDEFEHTVYWHYLQRPAATGMFVVRTALPLDSLTSAAQARIAHIDPSVALTDVLSMEARVRAALGPQRSPMVLTLSFAAIAVALAVIGVYGVLSWAVARRTREIGVRVSLGARAADILRMILQDGGKIIATGLMLGTAGALALGRVLAARIPEVQLDLMVLAGAVLALGAAALATSWFPAHRAARVDPLQALRQE